MRCKLLINAEEKLKRRIISKLLIIALMIVSLTACTNTDIDNSAKLKELEDRVSSLQSELDVKSSSNSSVENSSSTIKSDASNNQMESSSSSSEKDVVPRISFTNKFGTSTTKCAQGGCNNYIASSGDTNCCISHSNTCIECGGYIDGDALACMSCIAKALE